MKFAAEVPVKFQDDWKSLTMNLAASSLHDLATRRQSASWIEARDDHRAYICSRVWQNRSYAGTVLATTSNMVSSKFIWLLML